MSRFLFKGVMRPRQVFGMERIPASIAMGAGASVGITGQSFEFFVLGLAISIPLVALVRFVNNRDPLFFSVLIRRLTAYRGQTFYPARPALQAEPPKQPGQGGVYNGFNY